MAAALGTTAPANVRRGLEIIREEAGDATFILGCTCHFGPAIGLVDGMRVGHQPAAPLVEIGEQQRLFAGEVAEQRAGGDVGPVGDLVDGGLAVPLLLEQLLRRLGYGTTGLRDAAGVDQRASIISASAPEGLRAHGIPGPARRGDLPRKAVRS